MAVAPTEIRTLARSYTKAAINTLVGIMRQPKAPPAARVMAANALLDRGWGKAPQTVAVDGEIRQLVEVKLNVVHVERKPDEPKLLTNVLTNPEKHKDINATDLCCDRAGSRATARTASNSTGGFGSFLGPGRGTPVKTTVEYPYMWSRWRCLPSV